MYNSNINIVSRQQQQQSQQQLSTASLYDPSANNINYIINSNGTQVFAAHTNPEFTTTTPNPAGVTSGTITTGGALPPILAGKRIHMPLGPHRYL
jgi:hypothetical protein